MTGLACQLSARGLALLGTLLLGGPAAQAQGDAVVIPAEDTAFVDVPSGQPVTLIDTVLNEPGPAGVTIRYRFLAPEIAPGASISFDTAVIDIAALCDSYALPRLTDTDPAPDQIIISLSDRLVPFGQTDPEATQYFEAYRIENGTCVWELF
jgi:Family of unknown function (DUF6497)